MTSRIMKSFSLFGDMESISLPVANLVDLAAEGMADFLLEAIVNSRGLLHGFLGLFLIGKPLPSHQCADRHNGPDDSAAGLPMPCDPSGKGASRLEDVVTDHIDFFLQGCKNGLCSAMVSHFVGKSRVEDFLKKFLSVFHRFFALCVSRAY